jgi:hypothetical protein
MFLELHFVHIFYRIQVSLNGELYMFTEHCIVCILYFFLDSYRTSMRGLQVLTVPESAGFII